MDTRPTLARALGTTVNQAIREAGVSQRSLAARTGIPLTTLLRRLTGKSSFLITELSEVAAVLGVTVNDLISRAERETAA